MPVDLQSFPEAINEGLEKGFVVGNGLEYVSICCHIADSPLAQSRAAQPEDVTEERDVRNKMKYDGVAICFATLKKQSDPNRGGCTQSLYILQTKEHVLQVCTCQYMK